jgi:uncharacterized membrane protein
MDPAESNTDKILPKHSIGRSSTMLAIVIIVIQVLIALVTYPFMPDQVPTHWDAAGNINGYMPKPIGVFLLPFISIAVYLLVRVLYAAGPRLGDDDQRANGEIIKLLMLGVLLVDLVLQLTTTAIALHVPVDMTLVINLSLSVLFIFMGITWASCAATFGAVSALPGHCPAISFGNVPIAWVAGCLCWAAYWA